MAAGSCFKQQYVRKWEQKTTSKSICIFRVLRKRSHVQSPLYFQIHFYISDSDKIHFCIGTYMHPGTRCPLKIWSCWLVVLIVHSLFLSVSVYPVYLSCQEWNWLGASGLTLPSPQVNFAHFIRYQHLPEALKDVFLVPKYHPCVYQAVSQLSIVA